MLLDFLGKANIINLSFLLLLSCPLFGQEQQKRQLTESNYDNWGVLSIKSISDDGKWTSFSMKYENKMDTLFLQNTTTKQLLSFPKGHTGCFADNNIFAYLNNEQDLILKKLDNENTLKIKEVKRYSYLAKNHCFITWHYDNSLSLHNSKGDATEVIKGVTEYSINEERGALIYSQDLKGVLTLGSLSLESATHLKITTNNIPTRLTWSKNGKAFIFFDGNVMQYYNILNKKSFFFPSKKLEAQTLKITQGSFSPILLSDNGEKVFFSVAKVKLQNLNNNDQTVEVWNGNDNIIYPAKETLSAIDVPLLAVWIPDKNEFKILGDEARYTTQLTGLRDYAIISDPHSYGLLPKYYEEVDYYIKDVCTGAEKLLLKQQSHDPNQLCFSPISNVIVYYRDKNWWLYNPKTDSISNLTKNVSTNWDNNSDDDAPAKFETYGVAGWTSNGKSVLLYDSNDLWIVALDNTKCKRLTMGKEKRLKFRISQTEYESAANKILNITSDFVLSITSTDDNASGFGIFNSKEGFRMLAYGPYYLNAVKKSKNNHFVYSSQSFAESPSVMALSLSESDGGYLLFKSNKQQNQYFWGKSELIQYKNSQGTLLKGALFYPAEYDSSKKYPMIVHIYEKQSNIIHRYKNPSLSNHEGFNVTNFTLAGYFVLLPDISYSLGNPALSANECVTAAVKRVIRDGKVDASKIGLIGHSFGGYETNYILTQSELFSAAVSGAGISDTVQHYFGLGFSTIHKDSMWWYESQQFRMGSSFYKNTQGYLNNSPILYANKIRTPLLLWAGKNDNIVPLSQSTSFYMALRRLAIKAVFLAYPNEDHVLVKPINQYDLTFRIMQWFDYFLKGKKNVGWITAGTLLEK